MKQRLELIRYVLWPWRIFLAVRKMFLTKKKSIKNIHTLHPVTKKINRNESYREKRKLY